MIFQFYVTKAARISYCTRSWPQGWKTVETLGSYGCLGQNLPSHVIKSRT